jgi:hypothetical protein
MLSECQVNNLPKPFSYNRLDRIKFDHKSIGQTNAPISPFRIISPTIDFYSLAYGMVCPSNKNAATGL